MFKSVLALVVIGCVLSEAKALEATITVKCESPRQNLTVAIENATVSLILERLGKCFGFEVAGLQMAEKGEALSGQVTGTLPSILHRLLRNWNYMIVHSNNQSGIAKVMILNSIYGAPSQVVRKKTPSRNVAELKKNLEIFSGP